MIQKFLKYYRFVILVSILVMKYRLLVLVLSDRALIRTLEKRFDALKRRKLMLKGLLSRHLVTHRVNTVLRRMYPRTKCLVRSVILNESLILFGYTDQKIKFGVKCEEDKLLAHAWIGSSNDFKTVHEL